MIKLTVIVPIYNVEKYLAECLTSIFAQEIEDMEVIAIIDGSPDNSVAIARSFAEQHPNMRIIEQENRGLSATRNRGLREAQGEYVCWIDSDDYYTDNALAEAYRLCVENDLDFIAMAFHQFPRVVEKQAPLDGSVSPVMDGREFIRYTAEHNYLLWPSNFVHKRSFLLENQIFFLEGCIFEASPHAIELVTVANRCIYYNSALTQYRIRDDSLSHSKRTPKVVHDILKTLVAMIDTCEAADISAEYMPYFSDNLCKRACFCATSYAELNDAERGEFKGMCSARELMYFNTFVSPISYRNWLVKKHKKSAEDKDKKLAELSKKIASQQVMKPDTYSASNIAKAIKRKAVRKVRVSFGKLFGDGNVTYIEPESDGKAKQALTLNALYSSLLGNIVSTEAIATRYKDLLPKLYYHLVWRDSARTALSLSACGDEYKDSFDDLIRLLSDGRKYTLLPSFPTDRENVSICRKNGAFLWNEEKLSTDKLRSRLKGLKYDAVIAENISVNSLPVHYNHDGVYLDIIVLNTSGSKPSARITDAYLAVKNARAKSSVSGCDAYARINVNSGKAWFGLQGKSFYNICIPEWKSLKNTLCEIVKYLAVYNAVQFKIIITKNGPKILRMTSDLDLPSELKLSDEIVSLAQMLNDRELKPTEEYVENNKIYDERKEYWENIGSERHWSGFRPYMAMYFDKELEIDSNDIEITDEVRRWCYERGFLSYRAAEIGLNEENYRNYLSDYEYFWVNRINNNYQDWIAKKLPSRLVLDKFKDKLPKYYYSVRNYNGDKQIIALPDLPEGYTQSIDAIIKLVKAEKQLAIKKDYGSHGDGFVKFRYVNGSMYLNDDIADRAALEQFFFAHEGIYIITEFVKMHPYIAAMYPDTLNTVRVNCINTVGQRGKIGGCFFKVGHSKGGYTDNINTAAGGISTEVDKYTGTIHNPEFKRINHYTPCPVHPDTGIEIAGTLPHWDMIIDGVKQIANEFPQIEYMGFDIAITPEAFKVIEINVFPDYTKYVFRDADTQAFLRKKVEYKKKREHISAERHSWLD